MVPLTVALPDGIYAIGGYDGKQVTELLLGMGPVL